MPRCAVGVLLVVLTVRLHGRHFPLAIARTLSIPVVHAGALDGWLDRVVIPIEWGLDVEYAYLCPADLAQSGSASSYHGRAGSSKCDNK